MAAPARPFADRRAHQCRLERTWLTGFIARRKVPGCRRDDLILRDHPCGCGKPMAQAAARGFDKASGSALCPHRHMQAKRLLRPQCSQPNGSPPRSRARFRAPGRRRAVRTLLPPRGAADRGSEDGRQPLAAPPRRPRPDGRRAAAPWPRNMPPFYRYRARIWQRPGPPPRRATRLWVTSSAISPSGSGCTTPSQKRPDGNSDPSVS